MPAHGQAKLGFYPLPLAEADRLKNWLSFSEQFSALDPCVGDGIATCFVLGLCVATGLKWMPTG